MENKLGQRLRAARERAGLSQTELARRVGIRQQSIQAIEKGDTKKTRHLMEIAAALQVDPNWLAGKPVPMTPSAEEAVIDEKEIELRARELTHELLRGRRVSSEEALECYQDMLRLCRHWLASR